MKRVLPILLLLASSCSRRPSEPPEKKAAELAARPAPPTLAPLQRPAPEAMGKLTLAAFDYRQSDSRAPFVRASDAMSAGNWPSVVALARQAVEKDPDNLEAWWLLGRGQVFLSDYQSALASFSKAMAGDFQRYGTLAVDAEWLEPFRQSAAGPHLRALHDHYQQEFRALLAASIPVVASKTADHSEIYAYHPLSERFLRLSRTDGGLAGFIRDTTGRIAALSYKTPAEPELLVISQNGTLAAPLRLPTAAAPLELFFDADHTLFVTTGRQTLRVDANKLTPSKPATPATPILSATAAGATLRQADVPHIVADWDQDGTTGAFRLAGSQKTVTIPDNATALRDTFAWSPSGRFISFSTTPRATCGPTADERRATLFVVEAATGALTPLLIGDGPFISTWLSDEQLALVAHTALGSEVHVVAVPGNTVLARLTSPGGVALQTAPRTARCPDTASEKTP